MKIRRLVPTDEFLARFGISTWKIQIASSPEPIFAKKSILDFTGTSPDGGVRYIAPLSDALEEGIVKYIDLEIGVDLANGHDRCFVPAPPIRENRPYQVNKDGSVTFEPGAYQKHTNEVLQRFGEDILQSVMEGGMMLLLSLFKGKNHVAKYVEEFIAGKKQGDKSRNKPNQK